jgi:glycosyltransferase involved in cell wall biosynthesis
MDNEVRVYAPPQAAKDDFARSNVCVCRLPDNFGPRGLPKLDLELHRYRPHRILIQYVPHAYGWKAMNLPFALWVSACSRRIAPVWVMFHEVAFPFRWRPPAHAILGAITRAMARLVAGAAERLFSSTEVWGPLIRKLCPRAKPVEWLPIPSNIPNDSDIEAVRSAPGTAIGHFGTYGPATAELLGSTLFSLLAKHDRSAILLGRGGVGFRDRFTARHPELSGRIFATGELPPRELAAKLRGCDVLIQPFIDGISSRRTSVMAGLANGVPLVSNLGLLSESLWMGERGIALASSPNSNALAAMTETILALGDEPRAEMGRRAAALYREWFSLDRTLSTLRAPWESQR